MPSYDPTIEIYYHKVTQSTGLSNRVAPAPQINISPEIYYANDSVIGYTYNVTLNGYANSLRKEINDEAISSFSGTIRHIGDIRDIFNFNGGNLTIKYNSGNTILVAKGGTIKNLSFNNSDNKWTNYAPYTIELEFNEIDFIGCDGNSPIDCASTVFHSPLQSTNSIVSDHLVDMKKYKIKEFTDKWTFTIENDIYSSYSTENHQSLQVTYTLSATGKNFYSDDSDGRTIPAWQHAKLFAQERLYNQVSELIDSPATISSNTSTISACDATLNATQINDNQQGSVLLNGFDNNMAVYNETITCETSESDGTFSLTYKSLLKFGRTATSAARHTFTHNTQTNNSGAPETTITIQGTVQGLTKGGFIKNSTLSDFNLPQNGTFISSYNTDLNTRYINAKDYFLANVGNNADLLSNFKTNIVGVNGAALGIKGSSPSPSPLSYSLDHNYLTGSIEYTATYSTKHERDINNSFNNISVTRKDPTQIFQEFVIPGRASGPLIQKLNMYNPRTISINIDGGNIENKSCEVSSSIFDICGEGALPLIPTSIFPLLADVGPGWIKTKDIRSTNKLDGSYSLSLEYTCIGG